MNVTFYLMLEAKTYTKRGFSIPNKQAVIVIPETFYSLSRCFFNHFMSCCALSTLVCPKTGKFCNALIFSILILIAKFLTQMSIRGRIFHDLLLMLREIRLILKNRTTEDNVKHFNSNQSHIRKQDSMDSSACPESNVIWIWMNIFQCTWSFTVVH